MTMTQVVRNPYTCPGNKQVIVASRTRDLMAEHIEGTQRRHLLIVSCSKPNVRHKDVEHVILIITKK